MTREERMSRREFVALAASCGGYLALVGGASPAFAGMLRRPPRPGDVVVEEPWARIEKIADGVWAVISTPQKDRKTVANAAIVAGTKRVLVVEATATPEGARWVAEWAAKLGGRPPEEVVLTHFHWDHTGGLAGYASDDGKPVARARATPETVELVRADDIKRKVERSKGKDALLGHVRTIAPDDDLRIDLGGRTVNVLQHAGHTPSDVTVELEDPNVVIAGDLLWNGIFPNYMSAIPTLLHRDVRAIRHERESLYVPGHGPMATGADFDRYIALLDLVEEAGRKAVEEGTPAAEAAKRFTIPASLGTWASGARSFEVAFDAWRRELKPAPADTASHT